MSESSRTSGSFIQPRWKGRPNTFERAASMLMTIAVLAAFLYSAASEFTGRGEVRNAAESVRKSACAISDRLSQPLAATNSGVTHREAQLKPKAGAELNSAQKSADPGGHGASSAVGRLKADVSEKKWLPWATIGAMGGLGALFCFLGWQVRRATSALFGALILGGIGFALAYGRGAFGLAASIALALPPAFLGALLAWVYITLATTFQVGFLLLIPLILVAERSYADKEMMSWLLPVGFSIWALLTAVTYLFLVRAALISLMSVVGALLLTAAGFVTLAMLADTILPWQVALAMVAFLAILGNVVQYQYAGGGEEKGGGSDDGGDPGAKKPGKLRPKAKPA